ncbi:protein DENND6A-like isoform X1 [Patiria miniata]|uniref:UDENN domain-containing protein n=1 Tax=Patiria miniata TaxID=46514 RepID=A0A913ZA24_PATMI|nr:protein DENND6A-like isoform X1 [Patiria miniata]
MATSENDRLRSSVSSHGSMDGSGIKQEPFRSKAILPWDRLSNWLHCVCVVTFDLELGQALEFVYPNHVKLSEKEKMNICYLSFPDSNSGCMGDTQFNFRIRQCHGRSHSYNNRKVYDRNSPVALQSDSGHYYGFVYFRQIKDKSSRRGYFQKSLVVLSKVPYITLFTRLASIIAPGYFEYGEPSAEAACHDIDQWPSPMPGQLLHLPIMGSVLQIRIPTKQDKPGSISAAVKTTPEHGGSHPTIVPSVHEVEPFRCLQPVLPHIQLIWELVLTGEPVVVMAPSPSICSDTIHALVHTISPLRYMSDFRPYFTIHDSEFKEYTTRTQAPPSVILGVTNPFFAKTLQHWPHVIRIGEPVNTDKSNSKMLKPKKPGSLKTLESKPGLYTQYKPFLNKDKTIIKRLAKGVQTKRPQEVQDAMLRRHLLELTQSFMIPLERYVASLMPLQRNISPWKHPPRLKPFDTEAFLKTLEHSGPQLTSGLKGDWIGLYKKFFSSKNFEGWFWQRQLEVNHKLSVLHLEALCNADLLQWVSDKQEVQVVDLVLKLREKMADILDQNLQVKPELEQRLTKHIEAIITTLPSDLQAVLKSQ